MSQSKRGKETESHQNQERWLLTYSDMITLLMAFFIVLYSMANTDLKKFAAVAESMQVAFNIAAPRTRPSGAIVGSTKQSGSGARTPPIDLSDRPARQRDFLTVSSELAAFASAAGIEGKISVNMNTEGLIISLSESLIFESGSAELRPAARDTLDKVAAILKTINNPIRVEGHTDNVPTNSPLYPTNWELSVARAVSIVRYLVENEGITPSRLSAAGYAEYRPVVPNDSRANRTLNRRADIVIIYPNDSQRLIINSPSTAKQNSATSSVDGAAGPEAGAAH